MNPKLFPTSALFFEIIILISILIHVRVSLCQENAQYVECSQPFRCGNIAEDIYYPFYGLNRPDYCGHPGFQLQNCQGGGAPLLTIESIPYRVLSINNATRTLTVVRDDLTSNNTCPMYHYNTTLDWSLFGYSPNQQNVTLLYGCTTLSGQTPLAPNQFDCTVNGTTSTSYYFVGDPSAINTTNTNLPRTTTCNNSVVVPVSQASAQTLASFVSGSVTALRTALASGFALQWTANDTWCTDCVQSGGRCGFDLSSTTFACYCADQPYSHTCSNTTQQTPSNSSSQNQLSVVLPVVGAIIAGIGIGWLIFFCRQRRKRIAAQSAQTENKDLLPTPPSSKGLPTPPSTSFTRSIPSYPSSTSEFGKGSTYFGVQVFSYTELEEATDNFNPSRELGDGGFGTVYYGTLQDGRVVAVKRLYENNFKRVEQFMNEVEILTRLHHQYLVKLYGCTSKRSRELLLVYEYIPNGTVADHLHGKRSNSGLLSWPVRLKIAIETADALAYLHESDTIHRDVKTNNILLDNSFCVKVADFGLSRLFPNDATHVSTAPQGTPGYVDPEYYQCYQLTDKSDVYSFGVVLIELISSLQAVDTNRHRHDINLANMAISKIQNHTLHELVHPTLGFETDVSVRRMTTLVAELAFRCLQQEKDMRPTMKEVLNTLRGIQDEELNAQKAEVVDIMVDDGALLKDNPSPPSPDSVVTDKLVSSSTLNSSG